MSDLLLSETRGTVALLTLNRPNKLNALSYGLIDQLMAMLDRIEDDAGIRAVVLTGAGDRDRHHADLWRHAASAATRGPQARARIPSHRRFLFAAASLRDRPCQPRRAA